MDCTREQITALAREGLSAAEIAQSLGLEIAAVNVCLGELGEDDLPALRAGLKELAFSKSSPYVRFQALKYLHDEIKGRNDRVAPPTLNINISMLEDRIRAARQAREAIDV